MSFEGEILNYVNSIDLCTSCCVQEIYSGFFRDALFLDEYQRLVSDIFLTSDSRFIFCWACIFRYYKELSLIRKNGKMKVNKGKIQNQSGHGRGALPMFRKRDCE